MGGAIFKMKKGDFKYGLVKRDTSCGPLDGNLIFRSKV